MWYNKMLIFRHFLRNILLSVLGTLSTPKKGIHILNGHHLGLNNVNGDKFKRQLHQLRRKVHFISFEEAVSLIENKKEVSEALVAFTFDDGFLECYTSIAPIMEEFGINAAFFINPNFIDAQQDYVNNFCNNIVRTPGKFPMSWDQLKDLHSRGFIIGAHTIDHLNINSNDIAELEYQIGDCKLIIEQKLKNNCDYFAFPFGRLEHANTVSIDIACKYYKNVFSQSDYKNYYSFGGKVINRRHFEPFWKVSHVNYFISCRKKWNAK